MPRSMSARSASAPPTTASRWCWSRPRSARASIAAPLSKYSRFHTRICRPIGLTDEDRAQVCAYAAERIGFDYDLKNIIDLMRYLMPLPVPQRWRRRMMALGSGHPTRIICSALIAQAFESVRYPILPKVTRIESRAARREILEIRHSSLYAPRDFDISPYFAVVKPTIENGFDYTRLHWADLPLPPVDDAPPSVAADDATLVPQPAHAPPAPLRDGVDLIVIVRRALTLVPAARRHYFWRACSTPPSRPSARCSRRRSARCCSSRSGSRSAADHVRHRAAAAVRLARRRRRAAMLEGVTGRHADAAARAALGARDHGGLRARGRRDLPDAGGDGVRRQLLRRRDRRRGRARALSGRSARRAGAGLDARGIEGLKTALLALLVYLCAVPFLLFAGFGFLIFFVANAYLLGREYFLLAAMRFHSVEEAKALRKRHHGTIVLRRRCSSRRSCRSRSSTWRRRCSPWRSWCTCTRGWRAAARADHAYVRHSPLIPPKREVAACA